MKYLNSAPFSSQPATENYRNNYPFRDTFTEALHVERASAYCPLARECTEVRESLLACKACTRFHVLENAATVHVYCSKCSCVAGQQHGFPCR
jgi:hypothetical protein